MVIDHGPSLAASRGPSIDIVVKGQGQRPGLEAGPQRRLAQAGLQQQRQHEHEAAEEEQKGEVHRGAGREGPVAEQRQ
jgi:hypothetical protein